MRAALILFLVFLFVPFVLADSGCFVFQDSALYCVEVSEEEAEQECGFFDNCDIVEVFLEGSSCDKHSVPECETVLCKSTCSEEFLGTCLGGRVPIGEEGQWCSPGCCSFEDNCGFEQSGWLCNVNAQNKGVTEFSYSTLLGEAGCQSLCQQDDVTKNSLLGPVKFKTESIKPLVPPPVAVAVGEGSSDAGEDINTGSSLLGSVLFWVLLLLIGLFVAYYFHSKRFVNWKDLFDWILGKGQEEREVVVKEKGKDVPVRVSVPEHSERVKRLHAKRKHKVHKQEREEFLAEHGLSVGDESVQKLQRFVEKHVASRPLFHNLDHLVEKRQEHLAKTVKKPVRKARKKDIFEELRKMARK